MSELSLSQPIALPELDHVERNGIESISGEGRALLRGKYDVTRVVEGKASLRALGLAA